MSAKRDPNQGHAFAFDNVDYNFSHPDRVTRKNEKTPVELIRENLNRINKLQSRIQDMLDQLEQISKRGKS